MYLSFHVVCGEVRMKSLLKLLPGGPRVCPRNAVPKAVYPRKAPWLTVGSAAGHPTLAPESVGPRSCGCLSSKTVSRCDWTLGGWQKPRGLRTLLLLLFAWPQSFRSMSVSRQELPQRASRRWTTQLAVVLGTGLPNGGHARRRRAASSSHSDAFPWTCSPFWFSRCYYFNLVGEILEKFIPRTYS